MKNEHCRKIGVILYQIADKAIVIEQQPPRQRYKNAQEIRRLVHDARVHLEFADDACSDD